MRKKKIVPVMAALLCIGSLTANADNYPGTPKTTDNSDGTISVRCTASSQTCVQVISAPFMGVMIKMFQPMDRSGPGDPWYTTISQSLRNAPDEILEKHFEAGLDLVEVKEDAPE